MSGAEWVDGVVRCGGLCSACGLVAAPRRTGYGQRTWLLFGGVGDDMAELDLA